MAYEVFWEICSEKFVLLKLHHSSGCFVAWSHCCAFKVPSNSAFPSCKEEHLPVFERAAWSYPPQSSHSEPWPRHYHLSSSESGSGLLIWNGIFLQENANEDDGQRLSLVCTWTLLPVPYNQEIFVPTCCLFLSLQAPAVVSSWFCLPLKWKSTTSQKKLQIITKGLMPTKRKVKNTPPRSGWFSFAFLFIFWMGSSYDLLDFSSLLQNLKTQRQQTWLQI